MTQGKHDAKPTASGARRRASVGRVVGSYVLALVVVPALVLLAVEGGVRLFAPRDLVLQRIDRTLVDDRGGAFPHVNRAGFEGTIRQRPVSINARHLRGPAVRADDRLRLLLLGDSVWFGLGVADDEAPAAVLPPLLDDSVQVLNSGTIGYATEHQGAFLDEFGDALAPDAVLLGYTLNDPLPAERPSLSTQAEPAPAEAGLLESVEPINAFLRQHSLAFVWLKGVLGLEQVRHGFDAHVEPLYTDSLWSRNRAALDTIRAWCDARDIPFGLVVIPHRDQLADPIAHQGRPQARLLLYGTETGTPVLDLRRFLTADDYLFGDPIHLDADGLAAAMRATAAFFGEVLR